MRPTAGRAAFLGIVLFGYHPPPPQLLIVSWRRVHPGGDDGPSQDRRKPSMPFAPIRATLLVSYPSELMKMRPISTRVNKPENDDAGVLDEISPTH